MHELSIAGNILDIVRGHVSEGELGLVKAVRLRVGTQAGIVADSLRFSWEAITLDSPLAGAVLEIATVPFTIRCRRCARTTTPDEGTVLCRLCGSADTEIIGGTELQVTELELAEGTQEMP